MKKLKANQVNEIKNLIDNGLLKSDNLTIWYNGTRLTSASIIKIVTSGKKERDLKEFYQKVASFIVEEAGLYNPKAEREAAKEAAKAAAKAEREAAKAEREAAKTAIFDDVLEKTMRATSVDELPRLSEYQAELLKLPSTEAKKLSKELSNIIVEAESNLTRSDYEGLIVNSNGQVPQTQRNVNIWVKAKIKKENLQFSFNCFNNQSSLNGSTIDSSLANCWSVQAGDEFHTWTSTTAMMKDAIVSACSENQFDSALTAIENFKQKIKWDGKKRAEFLFGLIGADVSNSKQGLLNRKMTFNTLFATINRQYNPGCYFDHILQLQDVTGGTGKTKVIERLGKTLFKFKEDKLEYVALMDSLTGDRDSTSLRRNTVINILDENASMWRTKDAYEPLKREISRTNYQQRELFKDTTSTFSVRNIYFGTCNNDNFIGIYDGETDMCERRLWLVECRGKARTSSFEWQEILPEHDLEQIWAEIIEFFVENPDYDYNTLTLEESRMLGSIQRNHRANKDCYIERAVVNRAFLLNYDQIGWTPSKVAKETSEALYMLKSRGQVDVCDVFKFEFAHCEFDFNRDYSGEEILQEFYKQLSPKDYVWSFATFKEALYNYDHNYGNRSKNNILTNFEHNQYYKSGSLLIPTSVSVKDLIDYKIDQFCDRTTLYKNLTETLKLYK